jgi:signal transduction histidine kinase/CheY-like chemotaxis protein
MLSWESMVDEILKKVLDRTVYGFLILDPDLKIIYYNQFIANVLPKQEVLNLPIFEAFPELVSSRLEDCIIAARLTKDSSFISHSLNKNQFPFYSKQYKGLMKQNIYINPIHEEKKLKYILIQVSDETQNDNKEKLLREKTEKEKNLNLALHIEIHQKEEYQNQLLKKKEELETTNKILLQMDAEKNEFLGMVAHDLKNPLSIIQALAEDLQSDRKDLKEIREGIQLISQTSQSMIRLVNDLLDSHTIETGNISSKKEIVHLANLIQSRIDIQKMNAYRKRILIGQEISLKSDLYLLDALCLTQVLDNFISNAIKFSDKDSKINVKVFQRENHIFCEVMDQGPGLTQEDQKKVFQKFSKLTPRPTAGEKSNGLGLFIVQKLAESAGGNVWVNSELGQGSCFGLSLPFEVVDTAYYFNSNIVSKGRVLFIDDEEIIRIIFANLIRKIEFEVDSVKSTEEALVLINQKEYGFVFIDMHLEKEIGTVCMERIKAKNSNSNTKYILCSGDVTPTNRTFYISQGFHEAIPKDFHLDQLERILK